MTFHVSINFMHNIQRSFTLSDGSGIDYLKLISELVERSLKPGEMPNNSEFIRKLILKEAKKVGLL